MTTLPPYFQSSVEQQKWQDGFRAGLKENISDIADMLEENIDQEVAVKLEALLVKIDRQLGM